jgi:hypothetical protein
VAFRFKMANVIAVGTFNIYIIHPKWLAEIGAMEKGTKVRIQTDFSRPGFRFEEEGRAVQWQVLPDRIIVESTDPEIDCGVRLGEVLDKLPWTPLIAIGTNCEFSGGLDEISRLPDACKLPNCTAPEGYEVKQRTVHVASHRENRVISSQLSRVDDTLVELNLNVHTEFKEAKMRPETISQAQEACRQFFAHRDEAAILTQHLFNVEIDLGKNGD